MAQCPLNMCKETLVLWQLYQKLCQFSIIAISYDTEWEVWRAQTSPPSQRAHDYINYTHLLMITHLVNAEAEIRIQVWFERFLSSHGDTQSLCNREACLLCKEGQMAIGLLFVLYSSRESKFSLSVRRGILFITTQAWFRSGMECLWKQCLCITNYPDSFWRRSSEGDSTGLASPT